MEDEVTVFTMTLPGRQLEVLISLRSNDLVDKMQCWYCWFPKGERNSF